eukprot:COSAG03_NODE_418_length_8068_cov_1035.656168_7_plen_92_part_00
MFLSEYLVPHSLPCLRLSGQRGKTTNYTHREREGGREGGMERGREGEREREAGLIFGNVLRSWLGMLPSKEVDIVRGEPKERVTESDTLPP